MRSEAPSERGDGGQGAGRIAFHYVIVDLLADYLEGEPCARDDALEARWAWPEELSGLLVSKPTLELLRRIGFHPAADPAP